jgi:hypothetical protein
MNRLLLVAVTALALFTAHALAASPSSGRWQGKLASEETFGEGSGYWKVTSGGAIKPAPQQDHIVAPSNFKCNTSNLALVKDKIPVENGEFVYKKEAYVDFFRAPQHKGELTWKGEFTSAGKVKGTIRFVSPVTPKYDAGAPQGVKFKHKECDTGKLKWNGKPGP